MKRSIPENINSFCLLCAKFVLPDEQHIKRNIFEYPNWINFVVEIIGFELCHDESIPDIVCNECVEKLNQYFAYRREIFNNVMRHHINYYNLKNDLTKVEFYQAKIRQNHFQNDCKMIDQGTKRMDDQIIITDVRTERVCDPDQSYLLEPMFQTSENVLETESGGLIHTMNDEITARRCAEINQEFKCEVCGKIYNKQHYYRKHIRKHNHRKGRQNKEKRSFLCHETNCGKLFDRLIELRKHMTLHGSNFKCPCCDEQFPLWYDYEWHFQVCYATQRGRSEDANDRRTRSKSRLSKTVISDDEGDGEEPNDALKNVYSFYDHCSNINKNHRLIEPISNAESESEASITSTMSDYCDSERLTRLQNYKIRKKHRQEKRQAEQQGDKYFTCTFHKTCQFRSTSLAVTMNHENVKHGMLLLYNCPICKVRLSSKENLIRHSKSHDSEDICISCNMKFDNKYDLEHHIVLLHHHKPYDCHFCSRSYLKQHELNEHLQQKHPNDNKKIARGIVCRLDSEGKTESIHKRPDTVSYTSKELIQKNFSVAGSRYMIDGCKRKNGKMDISLYHRRVKECWKYEYHYNLINSKPPPLTLSTCEDAENLQAPIEFFFKRASSPIIFYKEEDNNDIGLGDIGSSRSLSPITNLDKFDMFRTESHELTNWFEEPVTKRQRPDSTINYIPSFEELFPQNHIHYDQLRGISSKWS